MKTHCLGMFSLFETDLCKVGKGTSLQLFPLGYTLTVSCFVTFPQRRAIKLFGDQSQDKSMSLLMLSNSNDINAMPITSNLLQKYQSILCRFCSINQHYADCIFKLLDCNTINGFSDNRSILIDQHDYFHINHISHNLKDQF
jgi:hypothetical protein